MAIWRGAVRGSSRAGYYYRNGNTPHAIDRAEGILLLIVIKSSKRNHVLDRHTYNTIYIASKLGS